MTPRVRRADEDDWFAIWPFYAAIVDAGRTYALPEPAEPEEAERYWFGADAVVLVAEVDGAVCGSARMSTNRPGRGSHVATAGFMVDPDRRGRGVGRALGEAFLDWARDEGFRAAQFNAVVETNTSAIGLWKSLGFEIAGTVPEAFDHAEYGLVGLHVMHRRL